MYCYLVDIHMFMLHVHVHVVIIMYMYIFSIVHIHLHMLYMYTHVQYIYKYMYMYTCTCTSTHIQVHVHMYCTSAHIQVHVHMYCTSTHIQVYVHMYYDNLLAISCFCHIYMLWYFLLCCGISCYGPMNHAMCVCVYVFHILSNTNSSWNIPVLCDVMTMLCYVMTNSLYVWVWLCFTSKLMVFCLSVCSSDSRNHSNDLEGFYNRLSSIRLWKEQVLCWL